jgi:hypothetical protein
MTLSMRRTRVSPVWLSTPTSQKWAPKLPWAYLSWRSANAIPASAAKPSGPARPARGCLHAPKQPCRIARTERICLYPTFAPAHALGLVTPRRYHHGTVDRDAFGSYPFSAAKIGSATAPPAASPRPPLARSSAYSGGILPLDAGIEPARLLGKSLGQHLEEHAQLSCQVLAIRVERDNLQLRFPEIRQRDQRFGSDERDGMAGGGLIAFSSRRAAASN